MNEDETVFKKGDRLEQLYKELGKAYYEGAFEDPLPQLLPFFDEITKVRKKQEMEPEDSREQVGYQLNCPNCGALLEEDAVFCGNCGQKVK